MRKALFFIFIAVGAAVGMASALTEDWGVKLVMVTIGAVTEAAIGGSVSGVAARVRKNQEFDSSAVPGQGMAPTDLMGNYWRGEERPPLTSALEPEHGRHQFDPDKL